MNVKEESEKAGLKLNIQKTMIMASNPITSMANRWGNHRNSDRLYFFWFQNHCRWCSDLNLKMSAPWKKNYDQPGQHIKKQRYYFANKRPSSQSYSFSSSHVWMWVLDLKKSWRIDALELWCWKRLLRFPWTARRPNQSIIKEFSPEYILEWLILKLNLQYFDHLMQRAHWLEKNLILRQIEGRRRKWWQRKRWTASLTRWKWVWASSRSWWWTEKPGMPQSMGSQSIAHN